MRTETRKVYIADDGKEFEDEPNCLHYEKSKEFSIVIQEYIKKYTDDYYGEDTRMDIAKVIAEHFEELIEVYNRYDN